MVYSLPEVMNAITINEYGALDVLEMSEITRPDPKPHEVLIQVAYAGINPVDAKIREGLFKDRIPTQFPLILGWDVSGRVVAKGFQVKNFEIGDAVMAYGRKPFLQWGSYAEYMTFHAMHTAHKPPNLSFAEAAVVPLSALTAWQGLFDVAHLRAGQVVLIQAGAGGVGSFAIQFAKNAGAKVLATARTENHQYLRDLGVDYPIDYTMGNVGEKVRELFPLGVDVAFAMMGGNAMTSSLLALKPGGFLPTITEAFNPYAAAEADIYGSYVFVRPDGWQLATIGDLLKSGRVKVPRLEIFPMKQVAEAHRKILTGTTVGKIALRIGGEL